ncbi:hypothetical protein V8G54_020807 [Vigna mungo]|uniref:Uncharacterized protein n=1 Tax=Vigna mungo TaxID=3915 RepID=A0AAQ3NEB5_VIGMU
MLKDPTSLPRTPRDPTSLSRQTRVLPLTTTPTPLNIHCAATKNVAGDIDLVISLSTNLGFTYAASSLRRPPCLSASPSPVVRPHGWLKQRRRHRRRGKRRTHLRDQSQSLNRHPTPPSSSISQHHRRRQPSPKASSTNPPPSSPMRGSKPKPDCRGIDVVMCEGFYWIGMVMMGGLMDARKTWVGSDFGFASIAGHTTMGERLLVSSGMEGGVVATLWWIGVDEDSIVIGGCDFVRVNEAREGLDMVVREGVVTGLMVMPVEAWFYRLFWSVVADERKWTVKVDMGKVMMDSLPEHRVQGIAYLLDVRILLSTCAPMTGFTCSSLLAVEDDGGDIGMELGLWASVETGLMGQAKLGLVGQCRNWAYGPLWKLGLWANVETGLGGPV